MYASLGCGALSAFGTAGPNILGSFCFLGRDTGFCRNPFAKTPLFLVPETSISCITPSGKVLDVGSAAPSSLPPCKNETHSTSFCNTRGARTDYYANLLQNPSQVCGTPESSTEFCVGGRQARLVRTDVFSDLSNRENLCLKPRLLSPKMITQSFGISLIGQQMSV